MNCKPGDLAVLVRVEKPQLEPNIGKLVTVLRAYDATRWWVRNEQPMLASHAPGVYHQVPVGNWVIASDPSLRPIRPQADDAQDETLSWLPVPTTPVKQEA